MKNITLTTDYRACRVDPEYPELGAAMHITFLDFTIGFFTVSQEERTENFDSFSSGPFFLNPNID